MTIKVKIESAFESWGHTVYRLRWLVLVLSLLLTGALASNLPQLVVDNATESFLHEEDPQSKLYTAFRHQFGLDSQILIALEPPEIFDFRFLEKLRELHLEIEEKLPYVDEVTSLVNARNTRGEGDTLIVEDLMENWPETEADLEALRQRVFANPLYENQIISRDHRLTMITTQPVTYTQRGVELGLEDSFGEGKEAAPTNEHLFLDRAEKDAMVVALDELLPKYVSEDFTMHLAGGPVVGERITTMLRDDVKAYLAACTLVIFVLLMFLFWRLSALFLTAIIMACTVLSTFGFMVGLGIPFSISLQMVPVFVMCICVCNVVHVLVLVYQHWADDKTKEESIAYAFGHSGLAIVMTSVTTAAGMLSFTTADLVPITYLGVVSAIGVLFAFIYTFTLLPALIGILPLRRRRRYTVGRSGNVLTQLLVGIGDLATRRPKTIITCWFLLFAVSAAGLPNVRFSHLPIAWFPKNLPVRIASDRLDEALGGTRSIEVIVDTKKENGLHDPEILGHIERSMEFAESLTQGDLYIGKAVSIVDVIKETNQALNGNKATHYVVPQERALIAQELLLFENSGTDDLEKLTDSQFQLARITMPVPRANAVDYPPFLATLDEGLAENLGEEVSFHITGMAPLLARIFLAMITSMAKSYAFALVVITPLMIVLIGNVRIGLVSMIPNLLPVIVTLGIMGWLDIPLDTSTMMIGSILIGLAVDDTIHFLHRFHRYYQDKPDSRLAVRETLRTTGAALFFTSLVLSSGFLTIGTMGTMNNSVTFGFLTAMGIAIAFLADVFLAPALMTLVMKTPQR